MPVIVAGHDPEPLPYTYDLEKAAALLAEAGLADGFEFSMGFDPEERTMAELWQAELAQIGVKLNLEQADFMTRWETAMVSDSPDAPAANTIFWGPDIVGPYTYLVPFNMAVLPDWNFSRYDNPAYNALIDEANVLAVTDREAANAKFIEAQRMFARRCSGDLHHGQTRSVDHRQRPHGLHTPTRRTGSRFRGTTCAGKALAHP